MKKITKHLLVIAAVFSLLLCAVPAQAQADPQPTSFQFFFNGPARGMRTWRRDRETWIETYSSGQTGTFKVRKFAFHVKGMTGTLVQKVDERDFFVFIPNLFSAKMEVWTYKGAGPWLFLARMKDVTPVRID